MLFHEYFDGDNGRGVGASHQTGWTALAVRCLEDIARRREQSATPSDAAEVAAPRGEPAMSAPIAIDDRTEWLEADGLGGFASGTTSGIRTRRYHALLLAATTPPTGRMVLVNGLDAWIERPGEPAEYLTRQRYAPGIVAPENGAVLEGFADEPWPTWSWRLRDGSIVEQELFVPHGMPVVAIRWRRTGGDGRGSLVVRPFLSGRDTHALHHANPDFRFDARRDGDCDRPGSRIPACPR